MRLNELAIHHYFIYSSALFVSTFTRTILPAQATPYLLVWAMYSLLRAAYLLFLLGLIWNTYYINYECKSGTWYFLVDTSWRREKGRSAPKTRDFGAPGACALLPLTFVKDLTSFHKSGTWYFLVCLRWQKTLAFCVVPVHTFDFTPHTSAITKRKFHYFFS